MGDLCRIFGQAHYKREGLFAEQSLQQKYRMYQRFFFLMGVFLLVGVQAYSQVYPWEQYQRKLPIYFTTDYFYEPFVPNPNNPGLYPPGSVEKFNQSLPRLQLIKIAVDHLVPILTAYRDSKAPNNPEINSLLKTASGFQFFQQKMDQNGVRRMSPKDLFMVAEISDRGHFKVVGTNEERLGINDGQTIYLNVLKLNELNDFGFQQALLLAMHEIFHFDRNVPLGKRDLITADIAGWVEARTDELPIEDQKKLVVVRLNSPPPAELDQLGVQDKLYTSKRAFTGAALIFSQSGLLTQMEWDLYRAFQTIKNTDAEPIQELTYTMPVHGEHYILPFIKVKSVFRDLSGKIRMSYSIENKYYSRINGSQRFDLPPVQWTQNPNWV